MDSPNLIELSQVLPQYVDFYPDADPSVLEGSMEITDEVWRGAEPDVGITQPYLDDYSVTMWVGEFTTVNDYEEYAKAVLTMFPDVIEETVATLAAHLKRAVEDRAETLERPWG